MWESLKTDSHRGNLDLPRGKDAKRVLFLIVALALFVVTLPFLGQLIGGALFSVALLRFLSSLSWGRVLIYATVISAATYLIFVTLLGVLMPQGMLGI
jgi:hypothetical protein